MLGILKLRRHSCAVKKANNEHVTNVSHRLLDTWLKWGLLPLGGAVVLAFFAGAVSMNGLAFSERQAELAFQALLAISAALFLAGFGLDSKWTNSQKLARRIHFAAENDGKHATDAFTRAAYKGIVSDSIMSSSVALAIIGWGIALTGVLAAGAGLGVASALLLLVLALEYQLFVFSRHPYYSAILTTAENGELVVESEDKEEEDGGRRKKR